MYCRNKTLYTQMSKKLLESMTGINKDPFLQIINLKSWFSV